MGELHHALAAGVLTRDAVHAELGEILAGRRRGRREAGEITLFDSTGTAVQDVAAAALCYRRARASGAGRPVRFAVPTEEDL
jgi:ornithine cyclodeaminase/alanine dehydrogenase-like protein (mu-crystallin family)